MVSSCREDFRPSSREDFATIDFLFKCGAGRIDELVDGPNAPHITPEALDRCEASLEDIFNGRLFHLLDAALSDILFLDFMLIFVLVSKSITIIFSIRFYSFVFECFSDARMRMNLWKFLYNNFDELYLYCYYVASTSRIDECSDMGIALIKGSRVMNSFVHSLPMLLGPFKNVVRCVLDPPNVVGNPNFVFEGKTIQRMEPLVLTTLKWRMLAYTPCTYIDYFVRKMNDLTIPSRMFCD
ncbi:hypothetical protein H5410_053627 [Solanum commersonii]|uniref:Uncharacterized protein n=1 Tax=Solanum commersonii TaxID=4109 RepID=A0A9J5X7R1_SOLCO|nr:hypothetical protein H5410_053627 [Solanum commersonii]